MTPKDPERLRAVADSPLARIALASAAEEEPSPELSERMAKALGVSAAAAVGTGLAAASAQAAKTALTAGASTTPAVPWIALGAMVAVIVGGTVVGSRAWQAAHRPVPAPAPATTPVVAEPPLTESAAPSPAAAAPEPLLAPRPSVPVTDTAAGTRRPRAAHGPDVRDQTAIIDGARAAMAGGATDKALGLVRQYQERYPAGVFAPEAAALKIEALVRLDRGGEARALAERFVATQPAGPLTERVKAVVHSAKP